MYSGKPGEVPFFTALDLLEEFPGKFSLSWGMENDGSLIPFDSPEHPYVPPTSQEAYDDARIHPEADLHLWLHRSDGSLIMMFITADETPGLSLPTEEELARYRKAIQENQEDDPWDEVTTTTEAGELFLEQFGGREVPDDDP